VLTVYPAETPEQATASFAALLGDDLISYPTWLWSGLHARIGQAPVFRYSFELRQPAPEMSLTPLAAPGVFHTAEIVYVWDNLQVRDWPWRPEDRRLAQLASSYWVNFAKTGDPNGPGLAHWPAYSGSRDGRVMRFTAEPSSGVDPALSRYEVLDASYRPTPQ
jgi:para-nitrobenzyl esterase